MAKKIHPIGFRLGITKNWKSRWFSLKNISSYLKQDVAIRTFLNKHLKTAGLESVEIERFANDLNIIIRVAKPGLLIGRGGAGVENLKKEIDKILKKFGSKATVKLQIEEVKNPDLSAVIIGQFVANNIEKRVPYRKVLKRAIERVMSHKEAKGVKIALAGRIDGAEIARREWLSAGKLPLNTLRSDVDYAEVKAHTIYGVLGIKVWIYKGEQI